MSRLRGSFGTVTDHWCDCECRSGSTDTWRYSM